MLLEMGCDEHIKSDLNFYNKVMENYKWKNAAEKIIESCA